MHYWKLPQQSLYIDELVVCILATQIYRWGHACLRLSLLNQNLFICNAAPLEHSHKEEDRAETLQEIKELKRWREREREEWLLWWKRSIGNRGSLCTRDLWERGPGWLGSFSSKAMLSCLIFVLITIIFSPLHNKMKWGLMCGLCRA